MFGNTEPAIARQHGLNPVGPLNAFAFGKHKAHVAPGKKAIHARKTPGHFSARPHASAAKHETRPGLAHATKLSEIPQDPERLLTDANRLGDAGRLHEAVELCHDYLRQAPGSAKGYYLLGVLQDALGHPKLATDSFKKVLYLDPNHRDALLHLALKREADGDTSGAALLRARARRFSDKDASGRR